MPHHLRYGGLFDSIVVHQVPCLFEFAQHKFEPQFERLVDDDEVELVAGGWRRITFGTVLEFKQFPQAKVPAVGHSSGG